MCEAAWEAKAQAKYQRGGTMFARLRKKRLHEHRKKKEAQPDRLCLVSLQECGALSFCRVQGLVNQVSGGETDEYKKTVLSVKTLPIMLSDDHFPPFTGRQGVPMSSVSHQQEHGSEVPISAVHG
uniref:Uncharacterized protein n=1 Tax=Thermosporothrix sp. COM3 TaxID=2490863 RepID=A0A455SVS5_9CHLR|nr:hypothetical protein KTC_65310 [Thermosporothrix sp. COM3]